MNFRPVPLGLAALLALAPTSHAQNAVPPKVQLFPVGGTGWAKSSVNAAVFRTNSVISHGDTQFLGYYDGDGNVMLAKRKLGSSTWETQKTAYTGDPKDAHNVISLGVDGNGFLHMVWDLHDRTLRYAKSLAPGSLEMGAEVPMTGADEAKVSYPQFYALPNGDLLFLYRSGASGNGNAMLNRYDVQTGKWEAVAHPLVAGGGQRNAYLNTLAIDGAGGIHLSWVWRDSPDVATNHDICYAYSPDQGKTWQKSNGEKYTLPITIQNAEIVQSVPRNSELINQTSMTTDSANKPIIATYWRDQESDVPQFRLVWFNGQKWQSQPVGARTSPFRLSGGGTKRIPISRPQVLGGKGDAVYVVFRDEERGNGVSVATSKTAAHDDWQIADLSTERMGAWEPTFDSEVWKRLGKLDLFVQRVGQGDAETLQSVPPQPVSVLEWTP